MPAYPASRREARTETLHGQAVADPYRWLEELDSPETRAWVLAQSGCTEAYLETLPGREGLSARLEALWNFERFDLPVQRGERLFFMRNTGLQDQSQLYVQDGLGGEPRLLLDPNTLAADGTRALTAYEPDPGGQRVAFSLADGGSDWNTIRILDVASARTLDDRLDWVKFSGIAWRKDGDGFFYSRYDAPEPGQDLKEANRHHQVRYHRVGTDQGSDRLVHHDPAHGEYGFEAEVSEDGRYLVISVWQGTARENGVLYQDLQTPEAEIETLTLDFDAAYDFVGNEGSRLFFVTDRDAPLGRLVALDLDSRPAARVEVIPEAGAVLRSVSLAGGIFFAEYEQDAHSRVVRFAIDGSVLGPIDLPGIGTVGATQTGRSFGGGPEARSTFYQFTDFVTPPTLYRHDIAAGRSEVFHQPALAWDPAEYQTTQVTFTSRDGTGVPMFISHRRGLVLDGRRPTLLHGYGGFNISETPEFRVPFFAWMEMGGVYALANLRGGGEYGTAWHEAGRLDRKQNVFDDFIAAAEHLVESGYTSPEHLGAIGRSNGGLLVGAVLTQRPDLFGACVPIVGVLDMLRFHRFTIGWAWVSDYGSPDEPDGARTLLAYSPYHNLVRGRAYPPTLVCTGDHDDRVFPAHSYKFAAALQHAQGGPAPVLIRIDRQAGHGTGKPVGKLIAESADQLAFLAHHLHLAV